MLAERTLLTGRTLLAARTLLLLALVMLMPVRLWAVGWTPTEAGLLVDLKQGDRFLLSVWIDLDKDGVEDPGEEFFVINYNRYTGGYFSYTNGLYLKLAPQAADATEPSDMSIWSAGAPLDRGKYDLGGTTYTIWNDGKTLKMANDFQFLGELTSDYNDAKACDVVFIIPTERGVPTVDKRTLPSFDPNNTLGRGTAPFNGAIGTGFLGMTYREVYMFDVPRKNSPISYTNASLVTFNTTLTQKSWSQGQIKCEKGHAAYAFADSKHDPTTRTIFRLYLLDKPFVSCPKTYFFATDEQDVVSYRKVNDPKIPKVPSEWTTPKKIYTMDYLTRMDRIDDTNKHRTGYMKIPVPDSTYYYVGYKNDYKAERAGQKMGTPGAYSQFTKIRELPLSTLPTFKAPAGAYGRMILDSTSTADNHAVAFEPAGYMLKVSTGTNIPMVKIHDNEWVTQDMWEIDEKWTSLKIWATLMTGPEFREEDPGADIIGWTDSVYGHDVPVSTGGTVTGGMKGYTVIYTDNASPNGNMTFVPANLTKYVRYDNNGFLGVEIPNQYPMIEYNTVMVEHPRLKTGYTFDGWTENKDGSGAKYQPGDIIELGEGETVLYAQAHYNGTLQIAISFLGEDGKRYFITHPNTSTPRYARARHFDSWENTWQGMEDAENADPNYLSTFELRCPLAEIHKKEGDIPDLRLQEHVLDPRSYTMKGYTDSLTFYEFFHPADNEYLGLYYEASFNTILANNTWAGLFTTTSNATEIGWPNYKVPYIDSTKIKSTRYVEEYDPKNKKDSLELKVRWNAGKTDTLPSYVQYNPATDQFNGVTLEKDGTDFQISAVIVADEHYIILPDTAYAWRDTITFGYHNGEQKREEVWSSLIGKQLMAVMVVDKDTVYFHPNRKKIINDPNNLYLSPDFRITQVLELIHDSRVVTPLNEGDSVKHQTTDYHWHNNIVSGLNSPMEVKDAGGNYIDIIDTFRITVSHDAISKIKEYRGYWNKDAAGLKVDNRNGSVRHRDIIVRTKTYHYGEDQTRYALKPEKESYNFGPLEGQTQQVKFTLTRETYHNILDKDGRKVSEEIVQIDTLKSSWTIVPGRCSFSDPSTYFAVSAAGDSIVTIRVKEENAINTNYDTLVVSHVTIGGVETAVNARVHLVQAALTTNELVWSVVDGGKRYFIMAVGKDDSYTLQFREFTQVASMLYELGTKNQLEKGSDAGDNTDGKYITPWRFDYDLVDKNQLSLKTEYGINKFFATDGGTGTTLNGSPVLFTYRIAEVHTNANSNYEEKVRIKYGPGQWLKFNGSKIVLEEDSAKATEFSWSYLLPEYSLLNNGAYPSDDQATFGRNVADPKAIQTRYMAYREYSTLLDDAVTYLCHKEETRIDSLTSAEREWLTTYTIDTICDRRFATKLSALDTTINRISLTSTITATGLSPTDITYGGKYVNIVDTLHVTIGLQSGAPKYRFKGDWSDFKSVSDAELKIPLVRKTYHMGTFSTLSCSVEGDDENFTFPADVGAGLNHDYVLFTTLHEGTQALDVDNEVVAITSQKYIDVTEDHEGKGGGKDTVGMHLNDKQLAEVRLMDIYGNAPDWCKIDTITSDTITVKCTKDGVRSPRTAYLYVAYIIMLGDKTRFVNYRMTVSQASNFEYANNQVLVHSHGASGDDMMANGMQQVHENKRVLYYYPDQDVELPVRERAFYGWWRWYREGVDVDSVDVADTDVPDSLWRSAPRNAGNKYVYPFRIIGDSVPDPDRPGKKKLVTMGRWTVFHYKSKDYNNKQDPPAKNPRVVPPDTIRAAGPDRGKRPIVTYAVDISNYYDNLPMSLKDKNQVDQALMDTMREIIEPTLSLREIFELHPWTEMAERMENYKTRIPLDGKYTNDKYMEDHVMMAPRENALLLQTEQRYNYQHLSKYGHSESQLGYYMRDDNWSAMSAVKDEDGWSRQDSMIWVGGWDAQCEWYTYDPDTKTYSPCSYPVSEEEDFLKVSARKGGADTIYYCLRARSRKSPVSGPDPDEPPVGDYWFNICRYKIIYHSANTYGPKQEVKNKNVTKALITNEEIKQRYDVLERLDFDYIQPGPDYHIYPHPLPWADASYGYTYPETSALPHNRYHDQSDFPNHGEYGLINRIPYTQYWRTMEQHGGASNGYMIYCDGMASAGQVAALSLSTHLCAGQKMFFSGYVGNPSSQTGKSNPNFIFSVQGKEDIPGAQWEDITSYMTGDIMPSSNWYQIYFPILHNEGGKEYEHFRVRIYNVASSFDGNDFIIDDMCIFATKQPLIAYQAQTTCQDYGHSEEDTHVLLRVDYQGITGEGYNGKDICYTIRQKTPAGVESFVSMTDGYLSEDTAKGLELDTLYGKMYIPAKTYIPKDKDSIYRNMNDLLTRFDTTMARHEKDASYPVVREGYIYEILEGDIRPVKYLMHSARMDSKNDYKVHMSAIPGDLLSSICGMTSHLKVSNRMVLELNGEEQPETEQLDLCSNATYDISLRVKGSMYLDSVAPIDVSGSCINDWLLYGDTARESSKNRYGYYYSDIRKVVSSILRAESTVTRENKNQFATKLTAVDSAEMRAVKEHYKIDLDTTAHPYNILADLVSKGFVTLYKPKLTASVRMGDSLQYVIFPIVGTGSQEMTDARVEVCPNPILIKLKPNAGGGNPLAVGGLNRDSTELALPITVLVEAPVANSSFKLHVDSIRERVGIYSIKLRSTDDPEYREGVHSLQLIPDKTYPAEDYYTKGDSILLTHAPSNNYAMRPGYNYTFDVVMQTWTGSLIDEYGCEVGTIPFIVSIMPDYVRWEPQSATNNNWNDATNWIGIDANNNPLHDEAHYVPMANTYVLIPGGEEGKPYPVVQPLPSERKDSIQKVNFQYNQCNTIHFLSDAALANQQYIDYNDVVVDMQMPQQKWAFRTTPVEGMVSGDIFMANADLNGETPLWEVGEFDAAGRSYKTGNGSFWLSVYDHETILKNRSGVDDSIRSASTEWSKVTNALKHPLPSAQGWAVYSRTASGKKAVVRLPKTDDTYYYYGTYGEQLADRYESDIRAYRETVAAGKPVGKLAFSPDNKISQTYTLSNEVEDTAFVFGNPTMGYIDIWGFISDNCLRQRFDYMDEESDKKASIYRSISKTAAEATENTLTNRQRYLPPMHAIVVKKADDQAVTDIEVTVGASRVITDPSQIIRPLVSPCGGGGDQGGAQAPGKLPITDHQSPIRKGIMTVTAINPCSPRCTSYLLLGQGYHNAILDGEDVVLTTVNIDAYTNNTNPATPFNIYAIEGENGMSIDLRDEIVNVPLSFYMSSNLPYDAVTYLWFTGVNNMDGQLVLYDALTGMERLIIDGVCLAIETPEISHQKRYYIRRTVPEPEEDPEPGITTGADSFDDGYYEKAIKLLYNGHIYIIRNGHVYTATGQRVR